LNDDRLEKIFSDKKLLSKIVDQTIISLDRYQTTQKAKMLGILFVETFKKKNFTVKEYDTLALLWKLEGAKALPFDHFLSLEHTPQAGIDIIAEYRELKTSQTKYFAPIEVEYILENFNLHGHSSQQVEAIICWEINDEINCRKDENKPYKYYKNISGQEVPIFVLSKIEKIDIRTSSGVRL
jgi:hypothetical protein